MEVLAAIVVLIFALISMMFGELVGYIVSKFINITYNTRTNIEFWAATFLVLAGFGILVLI